MAAAFLIKEFESKTPSIVELKRGFLSPVGKKPPHKVMDAALVAI